MNNLAKYWPVFILLVFFSCKSRKKLAAPISITTKDTVSDNSLTATEKILGPTLSPWTYFSAKADISFTSGNNTQNAGSNIRMYKDSLIWVSINLFGIEGARMLINKDSMVLYDKLHKTYTVYNKAFIESIIGSPLNVGEIQNLILAKPIYALKFYNIIHENEAALKIKNIQPTVYVYHKYSKQFYTIDSTMIEDRTAPHYARVLYSGFTNIDAHNFPMKNEINAYNGVSNIVITMEFERPDFVSIQTFPFNIPSSYERVK